MVDLNPGVLDGGKTPDGTIFKSDLSYFMLDADTLRYILRGTASNLCEFSNEFIKLASLWCF